MTVDIERDAKRFNLGIEKIRELGKAATDAKARAYCRFSNFRVGAALLTTTNEIIPGVNVENASYPVGVCAERCAIAAAVALGHTKFVALAVATDISPPASPCGMCRQFIREFCEPDFPVFMYGGNGSASGNADSTFTSTLPEGAQAGEEGYIVMTIGELLPMSFGSIRPSATATEEG